MRSRALTAQMIFTWFALGVTAGALVTSFAGFKDFIPLFLRGLWVTVQVTVLAGAVGVVCAFAAGLAKLSAWRPLRWCAVGYIETFRGTSALVQLFWLFYVLPHFGVDLAPMTVAVFGLGLNTGAYGAELVRGAIEAVPRGQYEAATALNMDKSVMMRRIVLPQAFLLMLPPWGNLSIELLKLTALVSLITITDLTFTGFQLNQTTLRTTEIFSLLLVMYLSMSLLITFGIRGLERRAARGQARGRAA